MSYLKFSEHDDYKNFENKVNKTVKSSKSDLNESTAYVDPQISAIKDLMKRIS